jgi:hypothetical protein
MQGKDIRRLIVREEGPRRFIVAGVTAASGDDPGEGAHMVEVVDTQIDPRGWQPLSAGWAAGSCQGLAVQGDTLLAASHRMGVMRLNLHATDGAWIAPSVESGLAMRDPGRFASLNAVVVSPDEAVLMTCGPLLDGVAAGVHRSTDGAVTFQSVFDREFAEKVTLPATWLFCSGAHEVEAMVDDAAR